MRGAAVVASTAVLAALAAVGGYAAGGALRPAGDGGSALGTPRASASASPSPSPTPSPTPSPGAVLEAAKRSTVRLEGVGPGGRVGSGSIVSPSGLVLTNAHVAAPQAPGLAYRYRTDVRDPDPEALTVSVSPPGDGPAVATYRASVLVADGTLDLAVLQIDATADGDPLPRGTTFPSLKLGDVDALRTGDPLTVLGYPDAGNRTLSLSVTTGELSTFAGDPDGRVPGERFEIDTSARVAGGNSGGAAIDASGRLVGVPSARSSTQDYSGRVRAVSYALPLLERVAAGRTSGYRSPYVPDGDGVTGRAVGWTDGNTDACDGDATTTLPAGVTVISGAVQLAGASDGLDLQLRLLRGGVELDRVASYVDESVRGDGCVSLTYAPEDGSPLEPGTYELRVAVGPDRRRVATARLVVDPSLPPPTGEPEGGPGEDEGDY